MAQALVRVGCWVIRAAMAVYGVMKIAVPVLVLAYSALPTFARAVRTLEKAPNREKLADAVRRAFKDRKVTAVEWVAVGLAMGVIDEDGGPPGAR